MKRYYLLCMFLSGGLHAAQKKSKLLPIDATRPIVMMQTDVSPEMSDISPKSETMEELQTYPFSLDIENEELGIPKMSDLTKRQFRKKYLPRQVKGDLSKIVRRDLYSPTFAVTEMEEKSLEVPFGDNQLNKDLVEAVKAGNELEVKKILSGFYSPRNFSLDYQDDAGRTALMWAIIRWDQQYPDAIVLMLLKASKNYSLVDKEGNTVFTYASANSYIPQNIQEAFSQLKKAQNEEERMSD
jgi:hypothetical protein